MTANGETHKWLSPDFMIVRFSESHLWDWQTGKNPKTGTRVSHGTLGCHQGRRKTQHG
jgi:hypothetical protein